MKMTKIKNVRNMSQVPKSRIFEGKSTKREFSKEAIARIEKIFLFLVPMNLSNTSKRKLEGDSFLLSKNLYRQSLYPQTNNSVTAIAIIIKVMDIVMMTTT